VHNVALSWQQAAGLTAALAAAAAVLTTGLIPRRAGLAAVAREATLISGLYALWQLAGELSVVGTAGAYARGDWIERTERTVRLPSEVDLQKTFVHHDWVIHASNLYYATMHFGVLFVFLIWLFVRHRERYPKIRRVLALTTLVCLVIQLLPVAPPRLLPQFGYVDTAAEMGESVYSLGFGADSLSAMPSVHVAWAVLIAWAVYRIGSGPARWLGILHAVLTVFVVVVTANHFWADGIVAVAVLVVCAVVEEAGSRVVARARQPRLTERELAEVGTSS
jgi:PAP2 superfamily